MLYCTMGTAVHLYSQMTGTAHPSTVRPTILAKGQQRQDGHEDGHSMVYGEQTQILWQVYQHIHVTQLTSLLQSTFQVTPQPTTSDFWNEMTTTKKSGHIRLECILIISSIICGLYAMCRAVREVDLSDLEGRRAMTTQVGYFILFSHQNLILRDKNIINLNHCYCIYITTIWEPLKLLKKW